MDLFRIRVGLAASFGLRRHASPAAGALFGVGSGKGGIGDPQPFAVCKGLTDGAHTLRGMIRADKLRDFTPPRHPAPRRTRPRLTLVLTVLNRDTAQNSASRWLGLAAGMRCATSGGRSVPYSQNRFHNVRNRCQRNGCRLADGHSRRRARTPKKIARKTRLRRYPGDHFSERHAPVGCAVAAIHAALRTGAPAAVRPPPSAGGTNHRPPAK